MSKTLLVDLDGPVYPFVEHAAIMLRSHQYTSLDAQQLMDLYHTWDFWADWGIPRAQFFHHWEDWIRDGTFYSGQITPDKWLEPVPGSREALWQLKDAGWNIHILTARLDMAGLETEAVTSTAEWLRKTHIPYDGLTFVKSDKSWFDADAILDDLPRHLTESMCPERYLFPAKHNVKDMDEEEYVLLNRENPWPDLVATLCYDVYEEENPEEGLE